MTWAKLSDTFIDDPVLLGVPRGARLLHVEGIVWCCKQETDGQIPAHVLGRITDEPELDKAVDYLIDAGLWARTDTGFEVVNFLDEQPSREQVQARRADTALRKKRSEQHYAGDHSLCIRGRFCPEGAVVRDGTRSGTRSDTRTGTDTRPDPPDPTRPKGKGRGEGRSASPRTSPADDLASRSWRSDECRHGDPYGLLTTTAGLLRCVECRDDEERQPA